MKTPINKVKKSILLTSSILLTLFIIGVITLFMLGPEFLVVEDSPKETGEADAIIVLSGNASRLDHAVQLYEEGLADNMILTNATEPGTQSEDAVAQGVPERAVVEENKAESTYENAVFSEEIMDQNEWKSAIVVTNDYHSRRTKMTFENIYNDEIELSYSFASSFFNPEDGLSEREEKMTFAEYVKLITYSIRLLFH
ncbi:YdcF family protein [Halobacillus sp. H74]|uniref:YdcF family protein n=1 Tax=Halobacillus sp. H74 TaxID=3457436 RepID=UPI003FCE44DC